MPPSRAATNAKTAHKFQRRQSLHQAKAVGNKFTAKQSHFERCREEEQVRSVQQHRGTTFAGTNEVTTGDGLLGNKEAWQRQDRELSSFHGGSAEAPSPFELASRNKNKSGGGGSSDGKPFTTQSSATFGLSRVEARPGAGQDGGVVSLGTRSTRRVARFNLSGGGADGGAVVGELGGSAMGVRRAREPPSNAHGPDGVDHLLPDESGDGAPAAKLTKEERFKQVVASSRSHRAQLQRERAERDAETNELDKEINSLLHLLPKRNKEEEEREAFARSGTPAVRELLASYKQNHVAKRLTIKASGAFSLTDLTATKDSVSGKDRGEVGTAVVAADGRTSEEEGLDERSRELLARIRKGTARSAEEEEAAAKALGSATTAGTGGGRREDQDPRKAAKAREEAPAAYVEDDFDVMLNQMRMDTRRAHAADRLLDDEEEAELAAQQQLLEEDRRAVPLLGLAEKDQVQVSRGEWIRKGGDGAFQMDGTADEDVHDGNVDLPSSYEGDSEARSVASAEEEEETAYVMDDGEDGDNMPVIGEGEDEEEEGGSATAAATGGASKSARRSAAVVVGSAVLDRLLSELESLANSATDTYQSDEEKRSAEEQRQRHFMKLLTQLHTYATTHVLEVANTFRLVLIEAERTFLRGQRRALSRPMMLSLAVIANLFPMSDYRHEVSTPFYIFLCSTLMQMKLDSLACVHCYLGLCALLTQSIRAAGGKFVGEAVTALLNVLALQLPRSAIEPVKYQGVRLPIPVMERSDAALLATSEDSAGGGVVVSGQPHPWRLLETEHHPEAMLLCAYHQLTVLADLYSTIPAFPTVMLQPFLALDELLLHKKQGTGAASHVAQSAAVREAHAALKALLQDYATGAEDRRAPLAMRTFRPRPIRLFEPLLEERAESAVKTEIRVMKREMREDKKRVMRHLTAEATVQRRAREKEQSAVEAAREKRMHQVMGALQQQQHMMNTVDTIMAKAKSKSRKGISGAPTTSSSAAAGTDGGGDG